MKAIHCFSKFGLASASILAATLSALGTPPGGDVTIAQWDFNQGDLRATAGQPLQYVGDTEAATSFVTYPVGGQDYLAMSFPAASSGQGYRVTHGAKANGGGTRVNQYTLIMDLLYPASSDGTFRALLQTGDNSAADDADAFVHPANAVGVNIYHGDGTVTPDQWHRIALVFDLTRANLDKYVDGVLVGSQDLGQGVDGRWSLGPTFLLFADNDGDTAPGLVNSIQFRNEAMTTEQVAALGTPAPRGIPLNDANVITLAIQPSGANVVITVDGPSSVQLQRKTTLNELNWQDVSGAANTNRFVLPATGATGFFQVRKL